jgi:hypothetical protein
MRNEPQAERSQGHARSRSDASPCFLALEPRRPSIACRYCDGWGALPHRRTLPGRPTVEDRTVFDIRAFVYENECHPENIKDEWRGPYSRRGQTLTIKSVRGFHIQVSCDGKNIKAECKGGPLQPVKGRSAAARLAAAIGQVIVSGSNAQSEELRVVVPDSPTFENAGERIIESRAFAYTGIRIALVGRNGVRLLRYKTTKTGLSA